MGGFMQSPGFTKPTMEYLEKQKAIRDKELFDELLTGYESEEELNKAFETWMTDMKDPNSNLYDKTLNDKMEKLYGQRNRAMSQKEKDDINQQLNNLVTDRIKEIYFKGAKTGDNQLLDEIIDKTFLESNVHARDIFAGQRAAREWEYTEADKAENYKKGEWSRTLGTIVDVTFKTTLAALTYGASGGQFSFFWGEDDPNFDSNFDDIVDTGGSGWGEDYGKDGSGSYYDPSTGEFGDSDGIKLPGEGEQVIPDYTKADPIKTDEGVAEIPIEEYSSYSPTISTGSFGEYGYSRLQEDGEVESKLGNFETITNMKDVKDVSSGPSIISDWVKNMPSMPKAASFLYPK